MFCDQTNAPKHKPNDCEWDKELYLLLSAWLHRESSSGECFHREGYEAQEHPNKNDRTEHMIAKRCCQFSMRNGMKRSRQAAGQTAVTGDGAECAGGKGKICRRYQEERQEGKE